MLFGAALGGGAARVAESTLLSGMSFNAARQSLFIMTLLLTDAPISMFTTFPPKKHRTPESVRLIIYFLNVQSAPPPVLE